MKKIYIDTENVTSYDCLKKIEIGNTDEIILFLTDKSKPLKPEYLNSIHSFGCIIKTYMIKAEKSNALDFYIVSHLGFNYSKDNKHFIVSNDKDFKDVLNCYNMFGYDNINVVNESWVNDSQDDIVHNKSDIKKISENSKTVRDFHNNIVKFYGKKGVALYHKYKGIYPVLKKSTTKAELHTNLVKAFGKNAKNLYHELKCCID